MYQLANCPFCGSEAEIRRYPKRELKTEPCNYFVVCTNLDCGCRTRQLYRDEAKAVEVWNRRVNNESF